MNTRLMGRMIGLVAGTLVMAAPGWALAQATSISGTVLAVNREAGTIVLGEVGPWRLRGGEMEITERTIMVTPSTEFKLVRRATGAGPHGWVGEFVEVRTRLWEVDKGDFVTVQALRDGQRLTALTVVVMVPERR